MRVLMLTWEYPPHVVGGLGKHVGELTPALAALGVDVHVVTPVQGPDQPDEVRDHTTVHRVGVADMGEGCDVWAQAERVNEALENAAARVLQAAGPFDLLHHHDWLTCFAGRALKERFKLPLLATVHATEGGRRHGQLTDELSQRINDAERRLTYEAWRVICCAHYMAQEIIEGFGAPPDKIDVIPNGVDVRPFDALRDADLPAFRARFAGPDELLVLSVGRLVYEKGIEILVRSAPNVLEHVPGARFVIAGKGPEMENLARLVEDLDLSTRVTLTGYISTQDRNQLYLVSDCAVFPSLYEPFGMVALEAMAARTPVVVSEVGGLREVVRHAETGITIYPGDVASCAWGIIHTLQHPEWARQRAENAHRQVLTAYNWETIAQQTRDVYQRVIDERARVEW